MKISEATASKLINIYQKFVVEYNVAPQRLLDAGGWGVVAEVLPMIKGSGDVEEWLHKATILSREDLRKEIAEKRHGIIQSECKHGDAYTIRVCRDCGDREKIYEAESL